MTSADTAIEPRGPESGAGRNGSIWTLFVGLGLLMVGNGLNGAVIGVRSTSEGFGVGVTGIVMAGYFAGFLLAPSIVIRAISSVGHIRVFAGLASTASSAVLVHAVSVVPITWVLMRFVFGFCFAGLYIVIESWLGDLSESANRGRTLALYMVVSMGGLGIGQYLIAVADPNGFRLFVLSSVLVSMSLVPITLAGTKAPVVRPPDPVALRDMARRVPTGVTGSYMSGAATGTVLGLAAVYSLQVGLTIERTAVFLLAPTLGGVLMQYPIGRLSDLVRRRVVIFGVAVTGSVLAATGVVLPPSSPALIAVMFGIGGCLFPLYSLVVSYTLDWMGPDRTVGSSATLVRVNGSGALVGPLVSAPAMSRFGPDWFFWIVSGAFAIVVAFIAFRIAFREALPEEREGAYVPFPARAGQLAIGIVAKPVRSATRIAGGRVGSARRDHTARRAADE